MVIFELYLVDLAQVSKAVGLMTRIASTHTGACTKLRKAETPFQALEFVGHEAVVEVDIVSDEDAVGHKFHEAVSNFYEQGRTVHHLVRDSGQLNDLRRN